MFHWRYADSRGHVVLTSQRQTSSAVREIMDSAVLFPERVEAQGSACELGHLGILKPYLT